MLLYLIHERVHTYTVQCSYSKPTYTIDTFTQSLCMHTSTGCMQCGLYLEVLQSSLEVVLLQLERVVSLYLPLCGTQPGHKTFEGPMESLGTREREGGGGERGASKEGINCAVMMCAYVPTGMQCMYMVEMKMHLKLH